MATLNLYSLTVAFDDLAESNEPSLKYVDWKRNQKGISVSVPKSEGAKIPAGGTFTFFDGTRATSIDGTTAFTLTLNPLAVDLYRMSYVGGTDPVLRTPRVTAVTGVALTLSAPGNGTLVVTAGVGTPFSTVQAGDEVMLPGPMTGDGSSPFSVLNQGRWSVLATAGAGASMTLARPAGQDFQGSAEVVTPSSDSQLLAYSAAGVQPGDKVKVSAGFSTSTQRTFAVESVTSKWIEFRSSSPLPLEAGVIPGAAGLKFYSSCKRWVRLEADQEALLTVNGIACPELSPWEAASKTGVAEYAQTGPIFSLTIQNRSAQLLNVTLLSAE